LSFIFFPPRQVPRPRLDNCEFLPFQRIEQSGASRCARPPPRPPPSAAGNPSTLGSDIAARIGEAPCRKGRELVMAPSSRWVDGVLARPAYDCTCFEVCIGAPEVVTVPRGSARDGLRRHLPQLLAGPAQLSLGLDLRRAASRAAIRPSLGPWPVCIDGGKFPTLFIWKTLDPLTPHGRFKERRWPSGINSEIVVLRP